MFGASNVSQIWRVIAQDGAASGVASRAAASAGRPSVVEGASPAASESAGPPPPRCSSNPSRPHAPATSTTTSQRAIRAIIRPARTTQAWRL